MRITDAKEINRLVKAKADDLQKLRDRFDEDFELLTLEPYVPTDSTGKERKGYQSYTTTEPRNIFDKIVDGTNRAALTIAIEQAEGAGEEDRRKASEGELFLFGAFNAVDRLLIKRGEPPLREGMGWFIGARGWYACRTLVYVPKGEKDVVFDVKPLDPMHCVWEQGPNGLLWFAVVRMATKAQIESEYEHIIKGRQAQVTDWWDEETNSVLIGNDFVKEPTEHGIGHVPFLVGPVGSMPSIQDKLFESQIEHQGDSVWAASRHSYAPFNKHVSRLMDIHEAGMVGSMTYESEEGSKTVTGDPWRTFAIIPIKTGEKLERLELPKAPQETAAILQVIQDDLQKSNLPAPWQYGGTNQELSGRALQTLGESTRSVFSPRAGALTRVYTWICEELLRQFKKKGKVTVMTGHKPDDTFFEMKAKPSIINPGWVVKVQVKPTLPRDQEADIAMALAATQQRNPDLPPLMSIATARSDVMGLRDPDAEADKVLIQQGENLPPIIAARIAQALLKKGKPDLADQVLALLDPAQANQEDGAAQPTNGRTAPGQPGQEQEAAAVQLMQAVVQTLQQAGEGEIAEQLILALQQGGPSAVSPDLVSVIMVVLEESGQMELSAVFQDLMQGAGQTGALAPVGQ